MTDGPYAESKEVLGGFILNEPRQATHLHLRLGIPSDRRELCPISKYQYRD